jgi:hypothetical protein
VVGGTLTVEKVTGTWDGTDGDKTLWGTAELTRRGERQPRERSADLRGPRRQLGLDVDS